MYGQRRWTVPVPPTIKLVNTTICKIDSEMCVVVLIAMLRCPFPTASASSVNSENQRARIENPFTPVNTCSDLSVVPVPNCVKVFVSVLPGIC